MDAGFFTEDGNIAVMARSDDVIDVAGHRLLAGALEEVSVVHKFCFVQLWLVLRTSTLLVRWLLWAPIMLSEVIYKECSSSGRGLIR